MINRSPRLAAMVHTPLPTRDREREERVTRGSQQPFRWKVREKGLSTLFPTVRPRKQRQTHTSAQCPTRLGQYVRSPHELHENSNK